MICFIKAGDKIGESLASAYHAQKIGREQRAAGQKKRSVESLEKACGMFLKVERIEKAAQCQHDIGNILAAAGMFYKCTNVVCCEVSWLTLYRNTILTW